MAPGTGVWGAASGPGLGLNLRSGPPGKPGGPSGEWGVILVPLQGQNVVLNYRRLQRCLYSAGNKAPLTTFMGPGEPIHRDKASVTVLCVK